MSKLPEIKDEIVESTYQDAVTTPFQFIKEAAEHVGENSPALMTARVIDGLRISHHHGLKDALWSFRMTLFIPECFERLAEDTNSPQIRVARKTMSDIEEGPAFSNLELEQQLDKYSPRMYDSARKLFILAQREGVDPDNLNMSYKKMLRSYLLLEQQFGSSAALDPKVDFGYQEDSPTSLILIRKSIINGSLVDFILAPENFMQSAFKPLEKNSVEFYTIIAGVSAVIGFHAAITAGVINRGITEEYRKRDLEVPWVKTEAINFVSKSQQEAINRGGDDVLQMFKEVNKERDEFNESARKENPHIWNGLDLMKRISHFHPGLVDSVAYLVYKAWKNQAVSNYMRSQVESIDYLDKSNS